jgi:aminomethyltransferase
MHMLKRTPLFPTHKQLGARLMEFGGWEMPVQYTSIIDEHQAVRQAAGIFDISHMGEVLVSGPAAPDFLNLVLTNDVRKLAPGLGQYTLLCNERGGVIDDLYLYHIAEREYLMIINAARTDADVAWLGRQLAAYPHSDQLSVQDVSNDTGAVAVQGPRVVEFIDECFSGGSSGGAVVSRASELKKNQIAQFVLFGQPAWVSRTGYTGEDGFEVATPAAIIPSIWSRLVTAGRACGIKPAGLGARDTLRTEVCYPLYGHELDEQTTPLEAGLVKFVALDKGDFAGRTALAQQQAGSICRKLVAFKMTDKAAPPRAQYCIWSTGAGAMPIGRVTSGTQSPSLGTGIGLGYVQPDFAKPHTFIDIEIRGKRFTAEILPKPLYRKAV